MLIIRLSRIGKKNKPLYRVVISEKSKDLYGNSLEILGSYNPYTKELKINAEKTKYWISKGAGMSATVNNLLIEKKIIEGKKVKASKDRKAQKAREEAEKVAKAATGAKPASPASPELQQGGPAEVAPAPAKPAETKTPEVKA